MYKIFIILIIIGLTLSSKGQVPNEISFDTTKLQLSNSINSTSVKGYPERTTRIAKGENPLIIIDKKQFKYCEFSNLYFDESNIMAINVISPKNDSCKLYGKSARNGVVVISTKRKIYWVSLRQIFRKYSKSLFHRYKKTVFSVNNSLISPNEEVYIQKDLIVSPSINKDAIDFFDGKGFYKVFSITLIHKSGT